MAEKGSTPDTDLAARLGRTPVAIHARRQVLRRATGRERKPWRDEEDARLRELVGRESAETLARDLGRSVRAIQQRACELGLSWKHPEGEAALTASEVGRLLGLGCAKTVAWWAESGYLAATRGATPRQRGGRPVWRVAPEALRTFLRDYPWLYDRARIADSDLVAFVAALPLSRFIGVGEAARRLGYTEPGINKLIRAGYLVAEKRGPNWCIPEEAVATFVRPPRGAAARGRGEQKGEVLTTRRTEGYRSKREVVARQERGRANRRAGRYVDNPEELAARVGLSAEEVAYWQPRLPAGIDPARVVEKLREIAALQEEQRPTMRRLLDGRTKTGRERGNFGVVVPLRGDWG